MVEKSWVERLAEAILLPILGMGGMVFILWLIGQSLELLYGENKEVQEKHRKEEEERRWNSPEAVEQRRLAAEQFRAASEEKEQKRKEAEEKRKVAEEKWARDKWVRYHKFMRIDEVDGMSGVQFEQFIKTLLDRLGHNNVKETPSSGDQGADIICFSPDDKRTVVQTKRWKGPVGNSAIQEVLGAILYYDAEIAFVITNASFTASAKALARKDGRIHLVDRAELMQMIQKVFPRDVPEFDRDEYQKHVKGWKEGLPEKPVKRETKPKTRQSYGRKRYRRRFRPKPW